MAEFLSRFPYDYRGWNELGRQLLESKNLHESADSFHAYLKLNPFNTRAWNNLGLALKELGKLDEAENAFATAISHDPLNTGAMLNLSTLLSVRRQTFAAIDLLKSALLIAPEKASLWLNLGASLMDIGDFGEARKSFQRALELHPGLFEAKENIRLLDEAVKRHAGQVVQNVGLLIHEGRVPEARELLRSRLASNPRDKDALHNLGVIALHAQRHHEALYWFQKVVELDPAEEFALTQIIRIKCEHEEYESALSYCEYLTKVPNCEIKEVSLRSEILKASGVPDQAFDCLNAAIAKHPKSDALWFLLAECLKDLGRMRESLNAAQKCFQPLVASGGKIENLSMVRELIRQLRQQCD